MFSNKVGIGLRIVKNTMDLHHGTVNLDSTLGKGSTFTLLIPEGNAHFAEDRYEIVGTPEMEEYALPLPVMQAEGQEDKPSNKKHLFLLLRTMRKSGIMSVLYSVKIMPYMRRQTVKRGVMWQ